MKKQFNIRLDKNDISKLRKKTQIVEEVFRNGKVYLEYRRVSNQFRTLTRKIGKDFENFISKNVKQNPKSFWKYVNGKRTAKFKIPDLRDNCKPENAKTNKEKPDVLSHFFNRL